MIMPGWLSTEVEKNLDLLVGKMVFHFMRAVMTPPGVSTPREKGVTSSRRKPWIFSQMSPERITAWMTLVLGSFPLKESETSLTIRGIRVEPPTKTISWTLDLSILESRKTFFTGSRVLRNRSWHNPSERARVRKVWKLMSSKRESTAMEVEVEVERIRLVRSQATRRR